MLKPNVLKASLTKTFPDSLTGRVSILAKRNLT